MAGSLAHANDAMRCAQAGLKALQLEPRNDQVAVKPHPSLLIFT